MNKTISKIRTLLRHINNVQENCLILGEKLIEKGEVQLGIHLIAKGQLHDNSKFYALELEYLDPKNEDKEKLNLAIQQHNQTNDHHPEYFGSIKEMPKICLAELVADWVSRSGEMGTSVRDWINEEATVRFGFTKDDEVYKQIMEFVDLLCDKPFSKIRPKV